jgi:hypothetical protein
VGVVNGWWLVAVGWLQVDRLALWTKTADKADCVLQIGKGFKDTITRMNIDGSLAFQGHSEKYKDIHHSL